MSNFTAFCIIWSSASNSTRMEFGILKRCLHRQFALQSSVCPSSLTTLQTRYSRDLGISHEFRWDFADIQTLYKFVKYTLYYLIFPQIFFKWIVNLAIFLRYKNTLGPFAYVIFCLFLFTDLVMTVLRQSYMTTQVLFADYYDKIGRALDRTVIQQNCRFHFKISNLRNI